MAVPTAELSPRDVVAIRALLDASFTDFSDHDWQHSLGGLHAVVRELDEIAAHASLVQRRLVVGGASGRSLRCGYVEAVAVAADRRRRGLAGRVMAELEAHAPAYDILALCASVSAAAFYRSRGWVPWRGPSSVLAPTGFVPTSAEDGAIFVLVDAEHDLDQPIACDWRDGDVW